MSYAELDLISNFSFLEGGSHPAELVQQARALGLTAIGIADRNTLAGVVRAHAEAKKHRFRLLIGCRLAFQDGTELIVYPRDRAAYGRLCRLLSVGKSRVTENPPPSGEGDHAQHGGGGQPQAETVGHSTNALEPTALHVIPPPPSADAVGPPPPLGEYLSDRIPKNETRLDFADAVVLGEGLIAIARAPDKIDAGFEARLKAWRQAWPDTLYLGANLLRRGADRARLARLSQIAQAADTPMVATNAVLYHHFDRRPVQDVLTCIREKTNIDEAGFRLQANAERYLKSAGEMSRLFKGYETALARTLEIVEACAFSLDELRYHYPSEPVPPGKTADQHLRHLVIQGARERFGDQPPRKIVELIRKELKLIRKVKYPHYFLTVHDIVAWARKPDDDKPPILCQGRGSAANSVVCFCLGITKVNPVEQDLLFERFLSEERQEPPDIDVDFEHEQRERVMQYVYRRYGRHRAAIVATVIHYRPRSAIRDVGKALGLTEDVTAALANTVWGSYGPRIHDQHVDDTGLKRDNPRLKMALDITAQLVDFPRHLSQHVGGFVLTEGPLVEMVPIGNAAMKDRTFIEWDKDDIDELKIMKVDVLALGMLTAIAKAFHLIAVYDAPPDLAMRPIDEAVYDMMCEADTVGVFQVESRAQMAMLPRLRPRNFYDIAVQVAIVRPGPIQGGMVHPYLKTRTEERIALSRNRPYTIHYPSPAPPHPADELRPILDKTKGVPIFQEQAMKIAMVAAEFTGNEANGLRRAMATFRHLGTMPTYEARFVGRMVERGYAPEFAQSCFDQIKGFGEYGFPESHAISFAHLVYVSAWIKHHHPAAFCAALLNSQPMGFYSPAQLVRDAREHGVAVHHPDVNASGWDNRLIDRDTLQLGLRQIDGFRKDWAQTMERLVPFTSLDDLRTRAILPARALDLLAEADAFRSLDLNRRGGLWAAKGLPRAAPAPLFSHFGLDETDGAPPTALPAMTASEEVVSDYESIRLSLKAHPVSFLRDRITRQGGIGCGHVKTAREGKAGVCGVVLVRQRPGSAKGVCFITLEDETGVANLVIWPKVFEAYRPVIMTAKMLFAQGRIQRSSADDGSVTHLVVEHLEDRSADLFTLSDFALPAAYLPSDGPRTASPNTHDAVAETVRPAIQRHRHPRDVRVLPRSRDFH
jgi:error-prone DNA polymerase